MNAASLLRPPARTSRAIAALVVLALVGWLGVAATHLHLPGQPAAHAHLLAHAPAHDHDHPFDFDHCRVHLPGLDHDHHHDRAGDGAHGHAPGDGHPADERAHPCSVCLALDRGAGPSAPPPIVVAMLAATCELRAPDDPPASLAGSTVYRSRAPPVA